MTTENFSIERFLEEAIQARCEQIQNEYSLKRLDAQWLLTFALRGHGLNHAFLNEAFDNMCAEMGITREQLLTGAADDQN